MATPRGDAAVRVAVALAVAVAGALVGATRRVGLGTTLGSGVEVGSAGFGDGVGVAGEGSSLVTPAEPDTGAFATTGDGATDGTGAARGGTRRVSTAFTSASAGLPRVPTRVTVRDGS